MSKVHKIINYFGSIFFLACAVIIISVAITYNISHPANGDDLRQDNLATVHINLSDIDLDTLNSSPKDTKYYNNLLTTNQNDTEEAYDSVIIKGHGNASWLDNPKKSYWIKFPQKTSLFGISATKKWLLISCFRDISYLRNDFANYFAGMVEEEYALSGEFVELYIDNRYLGLYYLTHKVEIDTNVVHMRNRHGILVESDFAYGWFEQGYMQSEIGGVPFAVAETVSDEEEDISVARQLFIDAYNQLERSVINHDWETVQSLIDVGSFAKYYIISEFSNNFDAYMTSFYMYKNGAEDKIHAGPAWDYDLAFSNMDYFPDYMYLPTDYRAIEGRENTNRIIFNLLEFSEFQQIVNQIYQEKIAGKTNEMIAYLDTRYQKIWSAAMRDHEKWDLSGDFEDSYYHLRSWIVERCDFLDEILKNN